MLRTVRATRYVTPLREGGSLPAIVEADDLGLYVLKFRGAGQGPAALAAELMAGELGRAVGLAVPEIVFMQVDSALGRNEPDEEIRCLLGASVGMNLAIDYLPGSVMFDPAAGDAVDGELASRAVWFDAFVTNIDRTAQNPNLLYWHQSLYFIDHGAALYFHHNWGEADTAATPFPQIRQHVLLPWASDIEAAGAELGPKLTQDVIAETVSATPPDWFPTIPGADSAEGKRAAYIDYFMRRLEAAPAFAKEAMRARAELV